MLVCDGSEITVMCPSTEVILITRVFVGRLAEDLCDTGITYTGVCVSPEATTSVFERFVKPLDIIACWDSNDAELHSIKALMLIFYHVYLFIKLFLEYTTIKSTANSCV